MESVRAVMTNAKLEIVYPYPEKLQQKLAEEAKTKAEKDAAAAVKKQMKESEAAKAKVEKEAAAALKKQQQETEAAKSKLAKEIQQAKAKLDTEMKELTKLKGGK